MESMHSLLSDNPYFSAGFGLMGIGTALALLRQGMLRGSYLLRRRLMTTVEISSKDASYQWLLLWLAKQTWTSGNHFSVQTALKRLESGVRFTNFNLLPSTGTHYLCWNGSWIKIQREREKSMMDLSSGLPFETLTLTIIGRRVEVFTQVLREAKEQALAREQDKLIIYTSFAAEWRPFGNPRKKRPLDSVVLATSVSERIVKDLEDFLASSRWYYERGIPYRRGYLLHGPPGSGKSSFIQALAGEFDYHLCVLNLAEGVLTDDRLNHLLNAIPERSFLILEDIDAALPDENALPSHGGRVTFSGLLNALDGITSAEERIIFMTTNRYEQLDPALIRPGRVDLQQFIGNASKSQLETMFARFYPDHAELAPAFSAAVCGGSPSPAAVQGHFILHKADPSAAILHAFQLQPLTK